MTLKSFEAITGMGIKGIINNQTYYIGNRRLMDDINLEYHSIEKRWHH